MFLRNVNGLLKIILPFKEKNIYRKKEVNL